MSEAIACPKCYNYYYVDQVDKCPFCGAPKPVKETKPSEEEKPKPTPRRRPEP